MTQIDLPRRSDSGLVQAMQILRGIKDIAIIELNQNDIVRHPLVRDIVNAYDRYSAEKEEERKTKTKVNNETKS